MFTSVPDMAIAAATDRRRELLDDAAQHRLARQARRARRRAARAAADADRAGKPGKPGKPLPRSA